MNLTKIVLGSAVLVSTWPAYADETPVRTRNQIVCSGETQDSHEKSLRVVLQNSESFRDMPNQDLQRNLLVFLKSAVNGGRWFAVAAKEDGTKLEQRFWVYQESSNAAAEKIAEGFHGAKLILSSGAPKLELLNPIFKFEINMTLGEGNAIQMAGYFAIKVPDSSDVFIVPSLSCQFQEADPQ